MVQEFKPGTVHIDQYLPETHQDVDHSTHGYVDMDRIQIDMANRMPCLEVLSTMVRTHDMIAADLCNVNQGSLYWSVASDCHEPHVSEVTVEARTIASLIGAEHGECQSLYFRH
ncbi:hypothetical protein MUK42_14577 [Musa troglodytarum]|uniref:Uncharacterized protein n=1 Tax=Musa troglodytarum TaxID=320322 RepID=A0A9E7HQ08_9LILI|nr:hypothetical protein MUK42_14577 [Musa troglodytarum]